MSIELLKCPACSAPVRVESATVNAVINCPYCGHSGYFTPEMRAEKITAPSGGLDYAVDIVMCIDATASMTPFLAQVKNNALRFYDDLTVAMARKHKRIEFLRVKVIAFRDYFEDGRHSMVTSDFFRLPDQKSAFNSFISGIHAKGGGDLPESGLEALALAIQSDWTLAGSKRRHIAVLWTDTTAHELQRGRDARPSNYPDNIPGDLNELTDLWESHPVLTAGSKRLIVFAPEKYPWADLSSHWSNTILFPSPAGAGLNSLDYRTILDSIANSV
jgi:hypothetical protein